jgi:hypothetical protein
VRRKVFYYNGFFWITDESGRIIDESGEIVDESHGQPDLEQFSGLVRDFLLVRRAVFRLIASKNSGMTALPHAKETER